MHSYVLYTWGKHCRRYKFYKARSPARKMTFAQLAQVLVHTASQRWRQKEVSEPHEATQHTFHHLWDIEVHKGESCKKKDMWLHLGVWLGHRAGLLPRIEWQAAAFMHVAMGKWIMGKTNCMKEDLPLFFLVPSSGPSSNFLLQKEKHIYVSPIILCIIFSLFCVWAILSAKKVYCMFMELANAHPQTLRGIAKTFSMIDDPILPPLIPNNVPDCSARS